MTFSLDASIIESVPSREQLEQAFEADMEILGDIGPIPETPEGAAKWGERALENWASAEGISLSRDDIRQAINGGNSTELDATSALITLASSSVIDQSGVDPALTAVTIQSLADGTLSDAEVTAIAQTAGSIVGGVYGGPLGAMVGGALGAMVGGAFSNYLGLGRPSDEERRRMIEQRIQQTENWIDSVVSHCSMIRSRYWAAFNDAIDSINAKWKYYEAEFDIPIEIHWFNARWSLSASNATPNHFKLDPFVFNPNGKPRKSVRAVRCESTLIETGTPYNPDAPNETEADYWEKLFEQGKLRINDEVIDPSILEERRKQVPKIGGSPAYRTGYLKPVASCLWMPKKFTGSPYPEFKAPSSASKYAKTWSAFRAYGHSYVIPDRQPSSCTRQDMGYGEAWYSLERVRAQIETTFAHEVSELESLYTAKVALGGDLLMSAAAASIEREIGVAKLKKPVSLAPLALGSGALALGGLLLLRR